MVHFVAAIQLYTARSKLLQLLSGANNCITDRFSAVPGSGRRQPAEETSCLRAKEPKSDCEMESTRRQKMKEVWASRKRSKDLRQGRRGHPSGGSRRHLKRARGQGLGCLGLICSAPGPHPPRASSPPSSPPSWSLHAVPAPRSQERHRSTNGTWLVVPSIQSLYPIPVCLFVPLSLPRGQRSDARSVAHAARACF